MLSRFFIQRPKFALVISIILTLAGAISLLVLPVSEYPEISPPSVNVTAYYTGASAEVVEQAIADPIETSVNGVEDMIYMSSKSANDGSYSLNVTFDIGTDPDMAQVNVQNRVTQIESKLPPEVRMVGVTVKKNSPDLLMVLNFYSPEGKYNDQFLINYVNLNVKDQLARVKGISNVSVIGGGEYAMRVWLDPEKLASLKMTTSDVYAALAEQNVQVAAGNIGAAPYANPQEVQFNLVTKGRLETVEEFEGVMLRANPDGSAVYLKDVARVELGKNFYNGTGLFRGQDASIVVLSLQSGANALESGGLVMERLEELSKTFPEGMVYETSYDTTLFVEESIKGVVKTLIEAILLVIAVTYLFLGSARATLIPVIAIPVSLIGTFAIMLATGFTINTVTLFGLILAIGIVVDDAILVIENVDTIMKRDPSLTPRQATLKAMKEVTGPIITSTLVLLAVFIPVAMLPGITGIMYRQFALTICISVVISSINALTLSPAVCSLVLKQGGGNTAKWFDAFNRVLDKVTSQYGKAAGFLVKKTILALIFFGVAVAAVSFLAKTTSTAFVPQEDKGIMLVNVQLPDSASLSRTEAVTEKLMDVINQEPSIEGVTVANGYAFLTGAAASNGASLFVKLKDWDYRNNLDGDHSSFAVTNRINARAAQEIPEAVVFAMGAPAVPGMGAGSGFEFVLEENYKVGLAISMFTMFALALLTRQIIQRLVSNELKSLMEYTRSAGDRIESSEFQGSSIYEFDHVGHTLEKTFEELREKDKSFQDLFNFSLSPIIVWDTEGGVLRMNPAAERALNSKLDMSDSEIDDRFKSFQSKVAFYLRMVMTGETLMGVNVPIENKIYRWNLSPLEFDNEIHAIIGQGQDITTLIEAEKQSNLARIEAERSAVARADFLAKMSHEIRTPLNGILGITQILQSTLDKPENKEKVDILYQSGEHLLTVLNDILDFSKIEQGKLNIEFNEFVFRDLVKSLETIYMPLCVNKGLSLEIQNEIPEKQIIRTDQVRLNQILFNLLSNAVKFTSEGGVIVRFMMESHEPGKEILKLEVRDSGIGISESSLETMFEPFIQAESTTTREYGGSGLGLAIVKNLLDLMGGSIKVTSMQGEGASFYIQLPVTVVSQIQREEVEASNHEDPATLFDTSIRVLLVEDNKSNAFIAKAFCQKYGMEVDWAEDGLIALEKVQTQEYDLILMDNQMPNLDGVEATRRMRHEMGIETPIYACTADAFESTKNAFLEAGANFVIVKPLKEKPLYNAFHHFKVKDLKVVNGDNAATGT
ncbi:efflux RND transporter permease subunit [Vibrio nigripulchritudo]|uniref:efflux RND transporter permease subunit n=1 Tax=Vibrio nigripulchritudo TaxID=28173 RepID=UPI0003B23F9A|nr:efflux RND transporter permease subunit [Vibrio nigripulchritudo]CCN80945.1 putative Histidine kinase [Vibrio nigripulchritudo BLFn1]